jgi:hypothetical protein
MEKGERPVATPREALDVNKPSFTITPDGLHNAWNIASGSTGIVPAIAPIKLIRKPNEQLAFGVNSTDYEALIAGEKSLEDIMTPQPGETGIALSYDIAAPKIEDEWEPLPIESPYVHATIVFFGEFDTDANALSENAPLLLFTTGEWDAFLGGVKNDEFDSLTDEEGQSQEGAAVIMDTATGQTTTTQIGKTGLLGSA